MNRWTIACAVGTTSGALMSIAIGLGGVAHGEPLSLGGLPVADVGSVPQDPPDDVQASEDTAGIHPALPPPSAGGFGGVEGSQYVNLFPTEGEADRHRSGGLGSVFRKAMEHIDGAAGGIEPGPPCFVIAHDWHMRGDDVRWPPSYEARPSVHGVIKGTPAAQQYPNIGVRAVRRERLEVNGSRGALEVIQAWVDAGTLGVRELTRSTMPLVEVAKGPGHISVYAAKSGEGDEVHFVVGLPRRKGRSVMHIGRHAQIFAGDTSGHSDCGHARLSLRARPGFGEQALVQVEVVVAEPPPAHEGGGGPAPGEPSPIREMRLRNLAVHLAVSQSASDDEVVPTVSFGWVGRERRQEVY